MSYVSLSLCAMNAIFKCWVIVLGLNLSCWVLRIWKFCDVVFCYCSGISIYLYFSLDVSHSHSLSLYSFCIGHNTDCDSGIFLGFALFGCCVLLLVFAALFVLLFFIRDHNTDCIFVGNCIVCLYCVSLLFIRGHYIDFDKPWNLFVGICIDCLYCVLLFEKWLGPCVPFICIVCFLIYLLVY